MYVPQLPFHDMFAVERVRHLPECKRLLRIEAGGFCKFDPFWHGRLCSARDWVSRRRFLMLARHAYQNGVFPFRKAGCNLQTCGAGVDGCGTNVGTEAQQRSAKLTRQSVVSVTGHVTVTYTHDHDLSVYLQYR